MGLLSPENLRRLARWAAWVVASALSLFFVLNTYWGFGGQWAKAEALGAGEIIPPLWVVWVLEVMTVAAMVAVLARSGILHLRLPRRALNATLWLLAGWLGFIGLGWFSSPVAWEKYTIGPAVMLIAALTAAVASGPD